MALVGIHAGNRIHRDIKSDNVLITVSGEIKLGEFVFFLFPIHINQSQQLILGTVFN